MPFKSLGLSDPLVQGILATGYTAPTKIQSEAIPAAIAGTIIKSYVYSKLVYTATTPGALSRTIDVQTIWPLFALSILILCAMLAKHYLEKK